MRTSLLLASLLCATVLAAQVKETVTVTLVEVPVTVVDRDGNPVRGLTAANFELTDDGAKRAISAFDAIDFASKESVRGISPLNPAGRRNFMLLFDLSFSSPTSIAKAQQAARDFVKFAVQNRDLVAVGTIDVDRGFRLLTAFTTDRGLVLQAIGDPRSFQGSDPLQIAGSAIPVLTEMRPAGEGARSEAEENLRDVARQAARLDDAFNRQRIDKELNMLGGLARTLRSVAGRKQVVLLSEGFDARLVAGRDAKPSAEQARENDMAASGEIWNIDGDSRFGSAGSLSNISRMADFFRRSDVVLHAIDIQGLRVQNDLQKGAQAKSNEALYLLANPTGGEVFRNANDLTDDFNRMLRRQEVVYILGFQAPSGNAGKFHDLKVRLVKAPSGARIQHRLGYYEAGSESALERSLTTAEVILNDIPQEDVRLHALATPFPTTSRKWQVPVVLEIDGAGLLKGAKGKLVTAEVFVYAFDGEGTVRDSLFQRMSLELDKVGDKLRAGGIRYYGTLALGEGRYAVRSLVRIAENDRKGYVRTDVVVPFGNDVMVSAPVYLAEGGQWLMVKGASHDETKAAYPFEIHGDTFIPTAVPQRQFAVFVHHLEPDEVAFTTTPDAQLLAKEKMDGGTKLVFASAAPTAVNVSVTKK
ncbi:MAG TPA: VWA domain-containing protein [Thermoanaerobaculia bacterium]|jgi:VWFA-related protein|nr:VWA domain-containing protein [Thermoanaerobaculia bacterium]